MDAKVFDRSGQRAWKLQADGEVDYVVMVYDGELAEGRWNGRYPFSRRFTPSLADAERDFARKVDVWGYHVKAWRGTDAPESESACIRVRLAKWTDEAGTETIDEKFIMWH